MLVGAKLVMVCFGFELCTKTAGFCSLRLCMTPLCRHRVPSVAIVRPLCPGAAASKANWKQNWL